MAKGEKNSPARASAKSGAGRIRKLTRRQKKQAAKLEARKRSPIPGSFRLAWQAFTALRAYWKPLGGVMLVYLLLNVIPGSLSNLNSTVNLIKTDINAEGAQISNAFNGFGSLFTSSGSGASQTSGVLQSLLVLLISLVIIWSLRQLMAGNKVGVKQAYYHSTGSLIPFLLVILVILVQLLPVTLVALVIKAILFTVFVQTAFLTWVYIFIFAGLAGWSLYMISSSLLALYIVTLPDMQPIAALRSAKNLARFRRLRLMRRVLYLPFFIFIAMAAIIVPLILFAALLVVPVFYVLSALAILFAHTYLYGLYRSLLE